MHTDNTVSTLLSIAGSDNTGGAGIQADIKTCCAFRVYAATAVTAVTAQNCHGLRLCVPMTPETVVAQLDTLWQVMIPDAVKIGMIPNEEIARAVAGFLKEKKARNIVLDPVLKATAGGSLTGDTDSTLEEMKRSLFPISSVITPNIPEAQAIAGTDTDDYEYLCKLVHNISGARAVLLKGGHSSGSHCTDFLYDGERLRKYRQLRSDTENTHGTGCALSTAIACGLAKGFPVHKAVRMAKDFISFAIFEAERTKVMDGPGPLSFFGRL